MGSGIKQSKDHNYSSHCATEERKGGKQKRNTVETRKKMVRGENIANASPCVSISVRGFSQWEKSRTYRREG